MARGGNDATEHILYGDPPVPSAERRRQLRRYEGIYALLDEAGLQSVEVDYFGADGKTQYKTVAQVTRKDGTTARLTEVLEGEELSRLAGAIGDFTERALASHDEYWNDGSAGAGGTVTIDVASQQATFQHQIYFERTEAGDVFPDPEDHEDLFQRLEEIGATRVEIKYDGFGDEGHINGVTIQKGDEVLAYYADPKAHGDLITDLEQIIDASLVPGWEINDGSYGSVEVDVAKREINFNHYNRYTDSEPAPFSVGLVQGNPDG